MAPVAKFLQMILSWALLGAVLMTLIAPSLSRMLITAPVNFGMNCEPAANWSQQALIKSQIIGLVLGIAVGVAAMIYTKSKRKEPLPQGNAGKV